MLWSLIKILAFVAAVIAITFGVVSLSEMDGGATIDIAGYEANPSVLQLALGLLVLIVVVWIGLKLLGLLVATLRFINGDDTAISRYFNRNRQRKGFDALSDGMIALAAGDGAVAMANARKAGRLLERPELTGLLTAQAAEMSGDREKATEAYKALLSDERTKFVGIRGILKQKLEDGDTETALALAQRAFQMKPSHGETQDVLLRLQAESHDWAGARETLGQKLRSGSLPRDVHKRRDAVLALSEAEDIMNDDLPVEAREAAIEANRLSPDLIPAAVMAARSYLATGNKKYATRVLKKAWQAQPHPDLAAAFAEIEPLESPAERLKRFSVLTNLHPTHGETKMLLTELHISAEDFPAAKRALGDLIETDPTARNLTLMAAIERGEGADDAVVRGWLTKALTASRGPQWVCENCGHIHSAWEPICSNCSGFDTLAWKTPTSAEVAMPSGTEMLPLIVGGNAPDTSVPVVVEDPADVAEIVPDEERLTPKETAEKS